MKGYKYFKRLFVLLCSATLLYQTIDVLNDYLRFDTIVMIENNDQVSSIELPSISICEKFPKIQFFNGNEKQVLRVPISLSRFLVENNFVKIVDNKTLRCDITQISSKVLNLLKASSHRTVNEEFDQINIDSVKCIRNRVKGECRPNFISIPSLSQCMTYFSQINSEGIVIKKMIQSLTYGAPGEGMNSIAHFALNFTDYYLNKRLLPERGHFMMVHDSRSPPTRNHVSFSLRKFIIKANKSYDLIFSRKTTYKLSKPYRTDCKQYESELNSTDIYSLSRVICINQCKLRLMLDKYNCLLSGSEMIYGQKYSDNHICSYSIQLAKGKDSLLDFYWKTDQICHLECKPDCIQEVFDIDLQEVDKNNIDLRDIFNITEDDSDISYVSVYEKQFAETRHYHWPKTKLTDFLCNIGGLISLWLGLSIISIYDYLSIVFAFFKLKLNSF